MFSCYHLCVFSVNITIHSSLDVSRMCMHACVKWLQFIYKPADEGFPVVGIQFLWSDRISSPHIKLKNQTKCCHTWLPGRYRHVPYQQHVKHTKFTWVEGGWLAVMSEMVAGQECHGGSAEVRGVVGQYESRDELVGRYPRRIGDEGVVLTGRAGGQFKCVCCVCTPWVGSVCLFVHGGVDVCVSGVRRPLDLKLLPGVWCLSIQTAGEAALAPGQHQSQYLKTGTTRLCTHTSQVTHTFTQSTSQ